MSTFHLTSIHDGQEDLLTFNILYSFYFDLEMFSQGLCIKSDFLVAGGSLTMFFLHVIFFSFCYLVY